MRYVTLYTLQAKEVPLVGPQDHISFMRYDSLFPVSPYGSGDRVDVSELSAGEVVHCRIFRYCRTHERIPGVDTNVEIEENFIAIEPRLEEMLRGAASSSEVTTLKDKLAAERLTSDGLHRLNRMLQADVHSWRHKAEEWGRRPLWRRLWDALKGTID